MNWLDNIALFEKKIYSQSGEDGVIDYIFKNIPIINKVSVEFGENGKGNKSNTYNLFVNNGWNSIFFCDKPARPIAKKAFITVENVNEVFSKYSVPKKFDLLSIDIDGNDYWVWKSLKNELFFPSVVVIEFNSNISPKESKTIKYNPRHQYNKNSYYGASLLALQKLGYEKGYSLIHVIGCLNAFFVRSDLIDDEYRAIPIERLFSYPVDIKSFCLKWGLGSPSWYNTRNDS